MRERSDRIYRIYKIIRWQLDNGHSPAEMNSLISAGGEIVH